MLQIKKCRRHASRFVKQKKNLVSLIFSFFLKILFAMNMWQRKKGQRSFCKTKTINNCRHISWSDWLYISYFFSKLFISLLFKRYILNFVKLTIENMIFLKRKKKFTVLTFCIFFGQVDCTVWIFMYFFLTTLYK